MYCGKKRQQKKVQKEQSLQFQQLCNTQNNSNQRKQNYDISYLLQNALLSIIDNQIKKNFNQNPAIEQKEQNDLKQKRGRKQKQKYQKKQRENLNKLTIQLDKNYTQQKLDQGQQYEKISKLQNIEEEIDSWKSYKSNSSKQDQIINQIQPIFHIHRVQRNSESEYQDCQNDNSIFQNQLFFEQNNKLHSIEFHFQNKRISDPQNSMQYQMHLEVERPQVDKPQIFQYLSNEEQNEMLKKVVTKDKETIMQEKHQYFGLLPVKFASNYRKQFQCNKNYQIFNCLFKYTKEKRFVENVKKIQIGQIKQYQNSQIDFEDNYEEYFENPIDGFLRQQKLQDNISFKTHYSQILFQSKHFYDQNKAYLFIFGDSTIDKRAQIHKNIIIILKEENSDRKQKKFNYNQLDISKQNWIELPQFQSNCTLSPSLIIENGYLFVFFGYSHEEQAVNSNHFPPDILYFEKNDQKFAYCLSLRDLEQSLQRNQVQNLQFLQIPLNHDKNLKFVMPCIIKNHFQSESHSTLRKFLCIGGQYQSPISSKKYNREIRKNKYIFEKSIKSNLMNLVINFNKDLVPQSIEVTKAQKQYKKLDNMNINSFFSMQVPSKIWDEYRRCWIVCDCTGKVFQIFQTPNFHEIQVQLIN